MVKNEAVKEKRVCGGVQVQGGGRGGSSRGGTIGRPGCEQGNPDGLIKIIWGEEFNYDDVIIYLLS